MSMPPRFATRSACSCMRTAASRPQRNCSPSTRTPCSTGYARPRRASVAPLPRTACTSNWRCSQPNGWARPSCGTRWPRRPRRLSLSKIADRRLPRVFVEAAPGLLAEPSGCDHSLQQWWRCELVTLELVVEGHRHRVDDVQTDHVGEPQRPDRVTSAEPHTVVDVLPAGEALLIHSDRAHQECHEKEVD